MGQDTTRTEAPLYPALVKYEDVAGSVGVQTMSVHSAYRALTDAIGGHGDLGEAQARFALEFPILAVMFEDWKHAAFAVAAALAELERDWDENVVLPLRQLAHTEEPPPGIGEYRQKFGERGVLDTADLDIRDRHGIALRDCE